MLPCNSLKTICLSDIDLGQNRFEISAGQGDLTGLTCSIKEMGIQVPPVVTPCFGGQDGPPCVYQVVSGFRRLMAAAAVPGIQQVPCLVMEKASQKDCAVRAVIDNAFRRELTDAELVRAVGLLGEFMDTKELAHQSSAVFNRSLNPRFVQELLAVGRLPQKALDLLATGQLALKPARQMTRMATDMVAALIDMFHRIRVSSGKQLDMMTCFSEICRREGITALTLSGEPGLASILETETADLGQKGKKVRQYLVQRRYPHLEAARKNAGKQVNRMKFEKGMKFMLPENFESNVYGISFEFRTLDEFHRNAAALEALCRHPSLAAVLDR